jgi:hypothetical protein
MWLPSIWIFMKNCPNCQNTINWCGSFNKNGHDDGDSCIHTAQVAKALRDAGYYVQLEKDIFPNVVIREIGDVGEPGELVQFYADDIPAGTAVGKTNPRDALLPEVVALLDRVFGTGEFIN